MFLFHAFCVSMRHFFVQYKAAVIAAAARTLPARVAAPEKEIKIVIGPD
jgi:hypothetical protein